MYLENDNGWYELTIDEYYIADEDMSASLDWANGRHNDPLNAVEVGMSYKVKGFGWGAGNPFCINARDVAVIADGLEKVYLGETDSFECGIKPTYKNIEHPFIELLVRRENTYFHVDMSVVDDIDTVPINQDMSKEMFKKQVDLWKGFAAKFPPRVLVASKN